MSKFLAVVRREYVQRVRSKMFVLVTVGAPLMFALFTVVPVLIAGIKAGGPTRLAVVDESGRMSGRLREALESATAAPADDEGGGRAAAPGALNQNSRERLEQAAKGVGVRYEVEEVAAGGRTAEELRAWFDERVRRDELDGYLVLPRDVLDGGEAEYHARNVSDMISLSQLRGALVRAVRDARLDARGVGPDVLRAANQPVKLKATKAGGGAGGEADRGQGFFLVFGVGFVIYLSILMYGQVVLGAVIEEKETRIAEILFSSIRPFALMSGKLIGVSLVALTQFAIWGLGLVLLSAYVAGMSGAPFAVPQLSAGVYAYLVLFFLLGYFIYATLYALVGSMVTTAQEGGQLAMPIILLLVVGFYLAFPVIRSPNSSFAVWVSMVPFFSPITMLIRIVTQQPPLWQIALSLGIGFGTVALLLWLAARVYRVGMLMYGKRATIPEVLKWVRQP